MKTRDRIFSRRELLQRTGKAAQLSVLAAAVRGAFPQSKYSMPGLYPGVVIGVKHSAASVKMAYQSEPIRGMIQAGVKELTGAPDAASGWKELFGPDDVVVIKVNPNGMDQVISSPAALNGIIDGLQSAGVAAGNIIVYERYRALLNKVSGWLPASVKSESAAWDWSADQTALTYNPGKLPGVTGYHSDYYVDCPGFLLPGYSAKNPAQTRSHLANAAVKCSKIISLTVLKDHQAAGFTLGLKNLCQGMVNNVNRAHPDVQGPRNYLNQFIPLVVGQPWIRNKVVLSIVDGVHGLWNAGPMGNPRFVWEHNTMYFATDVVAGDTVAAKALDAQRVSAGLPPEAESGADEFDKYHFRQPDHIAKAGQAGLGAWQSDQIQFRAVTIG
jgi:Domain of unknown function (DUF362)